MMKPVPPCCSLFLRLLVVVLVLAALLGIEEELERVALALAALEGARKRREDPLTISVEVIDTDRGHRLVGDVSEGRSSQRPGSVLAPGASRWASDRG